RGVMVGADAEGDGKNPPATPPSPPSPLPDPVRVLSARLASPKPVGLAQLLDQKAAPGQLAMSGAASSGLEDVVGTLPMRTGNADWQGSDWPTDHQPTALPPAHLDIGAGTV